MTTTTPPSFDDRLVSFLSNAASFSDQPKTVELVQTHISYVALTKSYVYKVARPVDFGFVDFSTLDKRRINAYRSIELNRRLCPDVYLDVVPIVERQGRLRFVEEGDDASGAVEFALRMRRMSDEGFLDRRLREGRVTRSDWDRLVATLVEFYRKQHVERAVLENARPANLQEIVFANLEPVAELHCAGISSATVAALSHYNRQYFDKRAQVLERRVAEGWIRDGHGDLRPEHIHISDDHVRVFDCIEFSDRLRHIDVAADVAFLAMELDFTGHSDESRRVCSAFADALDDRKQSDVLDFYKCYRACVRGKVAVLHSQGVRTSAIQSEERRTRGQSYYRLALNYASHGSRPILLAVMGRIATGKTTLANQLSIELGCETLHSDIVRKHLFGLPLAERPSESVRHELYSPVMTDRTYSRLFQLARERLRDRGSVILDATFSQSRYRAMLQEFARVEDCDFCLLELDVPDEVILARLRAREGQPDVISDARTQDFDQISASYQPPLEFPGGNLITVKTHEPKSCLVEAALRALVERNVSRATNVSPSQGVIPRGLA